MFLRWTAMLPWSFIYFYNLVLLSNGLICEMTNPFPFNSGPKENIKAILSTGEFGPLVTKL